MKLAKEKIITAVNDYLNEDFTDKLDQAIVIQENPKRGDISLAAVGLEKMIDQDYPHNSLAGDLLEGIGSFGEGFVDARAVNGFINFFF